MTILFRCVWELHRFSLLTTIKIHILQRSNWWISQFSMQCRLLYRNACTYVCILIYLCVFHSLWSMLSIFFQHLLFLTPRTRCVRAAPRSSSYVTILAFFNYCNNRRLVQPKPKLNVLLWIRNALAGKRRNQVFHNLSINKQALYI